MCFYCKIGSSSEAGPACLTSVSPPQGLAHVAAVCWIGIVLSLTSVPAWYLFLQATSLCVSSAEEHQSDGSCVCTSLCLWTHFVHIVVLKLTSVSQV